MRTTKLYLYTVSDVIYFRGCVPREGHWDFAQSSYTPREALLHSRVRLAKKYTRPQNMLEVLLR